MLLDAKGEVVSKAEFQAAIWGDVTVTDGSLAQCIADLRRALDDTGHRLVETVPRQGCRLNTAGAMPDPSRRPGRIRALLLIGAIAAMIGLVTWLWPRPDPGPIRLAVLRFDDLSAAEYTGQLSDAIAEGVIAHLARYPEFSVIAHTSSFRFRSDEVSYAAVVDALTTDYVIEGSQQFDGETIRVSARLTDGATGQAVWSDTIDVPRSDLLAVNERIGQSVANAVAKTVIQSDHVNSGAAAVDALMLSLKGRQLMTTRFAPETVAEAVALNRQAVSDYPDQPWGHVGLAVALRTQLRFGWIEDTDTATSEMLFHAERATEIAPNNYNSHFAMGRALMQVGETERSIAAFETSLRLNPSEAFTLNALAQSHFYMGDTDRALALLSRSEDIDPLHNHIQPWMTAWTLWNRGECDAARTKMQEIARVPPDAQKLVAVIEVCRGAIDEALVALDIFLQRSPGWTVEDERNLHTPAWRDADALERWIEDLSIAGLPRT